MSSLRTSRRQFLKSGISAAVAAPMIVPATALGLGRPSPSERINVGFIGVGFKGLQGCFGSLVQSFIANPVCQAVAVCDINRIFRDNAKATVDEFYGNQDCASYVDFRDLLARDDIDAVVIASPDHWHAIQTVWACRSGKDVYCEKPLSLTIGEARAMVDAARRYGRIVQTGSQSRSYESIRYACQALQDGVIGNIREVHVSCGGPSVPCNLPAEETPEHIDWDLWLGPAPWRPFHSALADKMFRPYRDYSGGGMTDWGCHHFDIAKWATGLDETGPVEVLPPDGEDVKWLTYRFANGVIMTHESPMSQLGVYFVGDDGNAWGHGMSNRWRIEPRGKWKLPPGPKDPMQGAKAHSDNFLECVRSRKTPHADVEIGARTVSICHLGNIAYWLNRPLQWDPQAERFLNDEEANRWLHRAYREPWVL